MTTENESFDAGRYIGIFLSYWWVLILLPTMCGVLGFLYSKNQDPIYEASATILVQYRGSGFVPGTADFRLSEQIASTYAKLATSKPFLERAQQSHAASLNGGRFSGAISAKTGSNPPVLNINVRDIDSALAARTAQVVAEEFISYAIERRLGEIARLQSVAVAQGITNTETLLGAQFTAVDSLFLLEPVAPPSTPVIPRTRQNVIIATMLGLLLAAGGALLLENLRDTVRFPDQLLSRFGVASLGTVFEWLPDEIGQSEIVLLDAPDSGYAEAFRQIRINIQFVTDNLSGNVILVSSPGPAEGKSTIITNLAVSIAQAGKRVVLVDGDMRRPSLHGFFDSVARESGLSNYLASIDIDSRNALETVIHATGVEDAYLIPSGPSPPNPAELLGLPLMSGLLAELRDRFDVVLVDSPPLLLVADGSVIAPQVDGAILVVDGLKTRSYSLDTSLNTLRSSGVTVLGVIINRLKRSRIGDRYRYPDYYRYHSMYDRYYSYSDGAEEDSKVGFYGNRARWARKVWSRFRRG